MGEDQTKSVADVHAKVSASAARWPQGAPPPLIQPHAIDDVPILALTVSDAHAEPGVLRQVAAQIAEEMRTVTDVAQVYLVGGEPRQVEVRIEPARLAAAASTPRRDRRGAAGCERAAASRRIRHRQRDAAGIGECAVQQCG